TCWRSLESSRSLGMAGQRLDGLGGGRCSVRFGDAQRVEADQGSRRRIQKRFDESADLMYLAFGKVEGGAVDLGELGAGGLVVHRSVFVRNEDRRQTVGHALVEGVIARGGDRKVEGIDMEADGKTADQAHARPQFEPVG